MKLFALFALLLCFPGNAESARAPVSEATEECLGCHSSLHPGIVEAWQRSRHAMVAPKDALAVKGIARKISVINVPEPLRDTAVGCAECHTLRPGAHADTFDHNEVSVHVVVSPEDCAVCHVEEAGQYTENIMAHAYGNLRDNAVYQDLERTITGRAVFTDAGLVRQPPEPEVRAETCYYCHGTRLEVKGVETRDTMLGEMDFPVIDGWPNQGVGRVNLDGSLGTCSACHTRHAFSIEMARKPHTCMECHIGPDVPAYKVYASSKHGNIYEAKKQGWDFQAVPWTIGKDFAAPTCAACHISLLTNTDGETIADRTHQMGDRLTWRLFGLIYAHPHPQYPDTARIRNRDGLPLPTDLDGTPATSFLIDPLEQAERTRTMQGICLTCHSRQWVSTHWRRLDVAIRESNQDIRTATRIMSDIWAKGYAKGLNQDASPFDESIERRWCNTWLFYGNTIRFSAAMAGGGDYSVFAEGRYQLSKQIRELADWLDLRTRLFPPPEPVATLTPTEPDP